MYCNVYLILFRKVLPKRLNILCNLFKGRRKDSLDASWPFHMAQYAIKCTSSSALDHLDHLSQRVHSPDVRVLEINMFTKVDLRIILNLNSTYLF